MEAVLKITGNKRDGYILAVALPSKWVTLFTERMRVTVWGEGLCGTWGCRSEDGSVDVTEGEYDTLTAATFKMGEVEKDVRAAKEALANLQQVDIERTIDL